MEFDRAIFIKRLNRFTVRCERDKRTFKAYLPNPGRLWEILLPQKILFIKKQKKGFLPVVWAAEKEGNIICLHTHYTNRVAEEIIKDGLIPELSQYAIREREFRLNNHRIDFLLYKGSEDLLLEVKSCTLFYGDIAMFPDAVTERGRRHLELLADRGGALLFIVHSPQVRYFLPDFHTDPLFSETLYRLRNRLLIKAISIKWDEDMDFRFIRELSIPWHIYEREATDRGSYMLTGRLKRDMTIDTGGLGRIHFKRGYYIYVGSAMNSLKARLGRHRRKEKKKRWHIDYLVPYLEELHEIPVQSSERLECLIAKEIEGLSDGIAEGFGSSDCHCRSHLYMSRKNPFERPEFIETILKFRIGRLKKMLKS